MRFWLSTSIMAECGGNRIRESVFLSGYTAALMIKCTAVIQKPRLETIARLGKP